MAKRGELRRASRARAGPRRCPRGGVGVEYFRPTPPPGRGPRALKGAGWCRLMHGWYTHDAGPSGGRLLVLSGTQAPWQVELQACLPLSGSSRKSRTPWGPATGYHRGVVDDGRAEAWSTTDAAPESEAARACALQSQGIIIIMTLSSVCTCVCPSTSGTITTGGDRSCPSATGTASIFFAIFSRHRPTKCSLTPPGPPCLPACLWL